MHKIAEEPSRPFGMPASPCHGWRRAYGCLPSMPTSGTNSWPRTEAGPIGEPAASLEAVRFVERAKLAAWERKAS
jgi:hypothetical protein